IPFRTTHSYRRTGSRTCDAKRTRSVRSRRPQDTPTMTGKHIHCSLLSLPTCKNSVNSFWISADDRNILTPSRLITIRWTGKSWHAHEVCLRWPPTINFTKKQPASSCSDALGGELAINLAEPDFRSSESLLLNE